MDRRRTLGLCLPALVVLCLGACQDRGAANTGRAAAQTAAGGPTTAAAVTGSGDTGSDLHPGGPGPDPNGAGSGGQGGTRPGAPYDIEAFENVGGTLDGFRGSYQSTCTTGSAARCRVIEQITGDPSDPSQCTVDSVTYQPQASPPSWSPGATPGKMREGTVVTAVITCPAASSASSEAGSSVPSSAAGNSTQDGGTASGAPASEATASMSP